MFIKIQYTAHKQYNQTLRLLTGIVNDPLITDVATLQSRSSTWHGNIIASIDFDNSEIIRTEDPTNVKMRYAKDANTSNTNHYWIAEFDVYDNPGEKWYVQSSNTNGTGGLTANWAVGTDISGSVSIDDASFAPNLADTTNITASITRLLASNTTDNNFSGSYNCPNRSEIRTMWVYVTNECMVLSYTMGTTTNNGMPDTFTTGANSATNAGPYFFGHYERWDYWNKASNGIVPAIYSNIWMGNGQGLIDSEWYNITNTKYQTRDSTAGSFRLFGTIDATPAVTTSWPIEKFLNINTGVGLRNDAVGPLNQIVYGAATNSATQSVGPVLQILPNYRFISEDLKATSFAMLPMTWGHSYYQNMGGSFTARSNVYVFNGEYFPGDEYTFNNKTYIIWPFYNGYQNRLGIAIPKE
jgi:hypothetical protein